MTRIFKATGMGLLFIFLWSTSFKLYAQGQKVITGTVTSTENQQVLEGVTVTVKGTKTATKTDSKGQFRISVDNKATTLVFTSTGMSMQEVAIGGRNQVDIALIQEVKALDDVVVIGYGTARKRDLTGATASMPGRDLEKIPVSSPAEALTGRLAGVQVTTTDGAPGAEIVIRVRGGGSVTQDNSPLYIVDGFPVSSINDIAPSDIASIDILKDAASTAIYGARGANGVVMITTKSAKGGKSVISLNSYVQARTLPKELKVLSPYEFVLAQYEYARIRSQAEVDAFSKYFGVYDDLELYKNQKGTDWQDVLYGDPKYSQQHNLSLTGGSDKTKFSFSLSNNTDEGLLANSGYQRTYFSFKLNHEISKALKFDLSTRYTYTVIDGAGTAGGASIRVADGITTRPVNGIADQIIIDPATAASGSDDYDQFLKSLINPIDLAAQDYRKNRTNTLNMNAGISWSVLKNLIFRSEFGINYNFGILQRYYGALTGESRNVGGNLPLGELTNSRNQSYRLSNTLTYILKKGDHDLNFLVGQEVLAGKGSTAFSRAKYFVANTTPKTMFANMVLGTFDRQSTAEFPGDNLASFFARANYQFKGKYLFTLTSRADASSKFAPGKQWGIFPAGGVAWRISQEDFMKNVPFVSDLKLRFSYGASGNNRITNDLYRRIYASSDVRTIGFGDVSNPYYAAASTSLVNPDLKWETTITRNLGLDFGLFNNRVTGTFDLYYNTTKDLLVESDIPSYLGYPKQTRNIGQTSNKGVELSLNGSIVNTKDLQLSAFFNIGFNRARIDKLDEVSIKYFQSNWAGTDLKTQDDYRLIVGQTVGLMYGYVSDGFYSVDDFDSYDPVTKKYALKKGIADDGGLIGVIGGYFPSSFVRPGIMKLKDLNGDGMVTAEDRQTIGSALPKFGGGFGFTASYKGFDLSPFFNYVVGNDVYNTGRIQFNMLYRTTYGNLAETSNSANRFKYVDATGAIVTSLEDLRKLNTTATTWSPFSSGTASPVFYSDAVEDGTFLRLNNISLGYSLPKNLISRISMTKLRLYVTVYNAFLWTNYSGYDPEVSATRSSSYTALTPGVDFSGYPKNRSYTVGINVTF